MIARNYPSTGIALFKCVFISSVAGYEDYLRADAALRPPPLDGWASPKCYTGSMGPSSMAEIFTKGDAGTGSIIQLTVTTVYEVLKRAPLQWERELMGCNLGHMQWSVAAMLLGLNALTAAHRRLLIDVYHMHWVPLHLWRVVFKDWIVALRRCPIYAADRDIPAAEVLMLRKVFNCTYRSKDEADFAAEEFRRTKDTPAHLGLRPDGLVDRQAWNHSLHHYLHELTSSIVSSTLQGSRIDDLETWWQARWAWTPSGSSSQRFMTDAIKQTDSRLDSGARPNKKSVFEELPDTFAAQLRDTYPFYYLARASTKPEPGGKARALYAVCDENFIITSYASVHVEKNMNTWGIKAKQTPADVVDWITVDRRRKPGQVWISLDYADYNTEHEDATLSALNWHMAGAWNRLGGSHPATSDKIHCAYWAAVSHGNKWVSHDDRHWRTWASLFSGDRDTARDNTMLHGVYSRMALGYTQYIDPSARLISSNYTGDDEDSLMNDWVSSLHYMMMHHVMGFVLKPAKQMVSGVIHEFLQRMAVPDATPTRPLFAVLAQLASGNWYKDVYIWYDSAISSVSDNVWELVSRGLPIAFGRQLAVEVLNATMRLPTAKTLNDDGSTTTTWKKLEWWIFRNGGTSVHPLWAGTGPIGLPVPSIAAKPEPSTAARGNATAAWVALKQSELRIEDPAAWKQYGEHCIRESYAGLYVRTRADTHKRYGVEQWPVRINSPCSLDIPGPEPMDEHQLNRLLLTTSTDRRPAKEDEVLARMGLDAPMVAALGGIHTVLQHMRPDVMQHYSRPMAVGYVPLGMYWHDPAIRAWFGCAGVAQLLSAEMYDKRLQAYWPSPLITKSNPADSMTRHIFLAPNGAGKSHFITSHPWCADTDSIVSTMQLHAELHFNSKLPDIGRNPAVGDAIHDVLLKQNYYGLTTQMDPSEFIPPPQLRSYSVVVHVIRPPSEILVERLTQRGWTTEKINRRLARWDGIIKRATTRPLWLSEAEIANVQYKPAFPDA